MRNCIAACVATLLSTAAAAQGWRALSLTDGHRWQQLWGQAECQARAALVAARRALAASGCAAGGHTDSRAHPFSRMPFALFGD